MCVCLLVWCVCLSLISYYRGIREFFFHSTSALALSLQPVKTRQSTMSLHHRYHRRSIEHYLCLNLLLRDLPPTFYESSYSHQTNLSLTDYLANHQLQELRHAKRGELMIDRVAASDDGYVEWFKRKSTRHVKET